MSLPPSPPGAPTGDRVDRVDRVLRALRSQVTAVTPEVDPDAVVPGTSLERLGCTSIDRAEITVGTMEELRVTLTPQELAGVHDIDSLVHALAGRLR